MRCAAAARRQEDELEDRADFLRACENDDFNWVTELLADVRPMPPLPPPAAAPTPFLPRFPSCLPVRLRSGTTARSSAG